MTPEAEQSGSNTLLFATLAAGAAALDEPARHRRHTAVRRCRDCARHPFNMGGLIWGWLMMVLAYTVCKLPFTVRSLSAILHQIDPALEEASIGLGVSPLRTFLGLVVPLILGGIVSGMVLTWDTVASELSSTVVLYSGSLAYAHDRHVSGARGRGGVAVARRHRC
jgi:hypothetical protein